MKRHIAYILLAVAFVGGTNSAFGQEPQPTVPGQPQRPPNSPVKLQIILSKYQGDKRLSSQPYTMLLATGNPGSLAIGAEVPVPTADPGAAYRMQRVGTDLSATVNILTEKTFSLTLTVNDRSYFTSPKPEPGGETVAGVPSFRTLSTSGRAVLSAGETVQFISALDPASNETLRIDVTLTLGNK